MPETQNRWRQRLPIVGAAALLALLALQLVMVARRESQTYDEATNIWVGYNQWTRGDFGLDPERVPLVVAFSALPILGYELKVPSPHDRNFKIEAFLDGREFLYGNNADLILFRARLMASLFTLFLAFLVFAAAREMFDAGPALLALLLFVFDPNVLAHGALVTTDLGVTCFGFATIYAFYRYVKRPTLLRMALVGLAAGCALAAKHSGMLVFPTVILLALVEALRSSIKRRAPEETKARKKRGEPPAEPPAVSQRPAWRFWTELFGAGLLAILVLWCAYGFRYEARPGGLGLTPTLFDLARQLPAQAETAFLMLMDWLHLLPESYLYGLADISNTVGVGGTYLFGRFYPQGSWLFFPAIFLIKSSLPFLILLVSAPLIWAFGNRLGLQTCWRERLFMAIPAVIYFGSVIASGDIFGYRHLLPAIPFFVILAGLSAWAWARQSRRWGWGIGFLLAMHIASSVHTFPGYMAYANELWGGPSQTYKNLTDSNVDWGQQLIGVRKYLQERGISHCWFAYYASDVADPNYYGIPCQPLPSRGMSWSGHNPMVPEWIDGTVLISASVLSGYSYGPARLNPYRGFKNLAPKAVIDNGVLVYEGTLDLREASAISDCAETWERVTRNPHEAIAPAQAAVAAAPWLAMPHICLGDALWAAGSQTEARASYRAAYASATTYEPQYQKEWLPYLLNKALTR